MKLLKDKGLLRRCYSQVGKTAAKVWTSLISFLHLFDTTVFVFIQNIDTLERVAGLEGDDLIEAHGTFYTSHCVSFCCRKEYNLDWMKGAFAFISLHTWEPPIMHLLWDLNLPLCFTDKIFSDDIPRCEKCNSLVKPGQWNFVPVFLFFFFLNIIFIFLSVLFFASLWGSPRYRLLRRESPCSILYFHEDGEHMAVACKLFEVTALRQIWRQISLSLFFSARTFLAVIFSSSWGRLCRSSPLPVSSAGTADHVSYCWELLPTPETAVATQQPSGTTVLWRIEIDCSNHLASLKSCWGKHGLILITELAADLSV